MPDDAPHEARAAGASSAPTAVWAPGGAPRRKRHLGLWIGTPVAVALAGLVTASLVLIAPGTAVAGVQIGGMTAGAAAAAIQSRLDRTTIALTGVDETVTGAQLGAKVDAASLAAAAYGDHPMWRVDAWFSGTHTATVTIDAEKAAAALRSVAPGFYRDAKDAGVVFDPGSAAYAASPAADGAGIDLTAVTAALQDAFTAGRATATVAPGTAPVAAQIPTAAAQKTATALNAMLGAVGFYVGTERTVPVDRKVAASWLTVTPVGSSFEITADQARIQAVVDTLAAKVDRPPRSGLEITDLQGRVLRTDLPALDGRTLGSTSGIAAAFAAQLAKGEAKFQLEVSATPATTTKAARSIVVSLSRQTAYLYENGRVVRTYLVSTGVPGHDTRPGSYRIFAKVALQDMGCVRGYDYCTKNVPWVSYFYPDVGFHGTYWHNNFGHVMSHGCVNMPIAVAKFVYDWAPIGTPVTVQR